MKHLYLDKNQTYGEIQVKQLFDHVAFLDYMMKLRHKKFLSDTSQWCAPSPVHSLRTERCARCNAALRAHCLAVRCRCGRHVLMTKGSSVHVFCIKRRLKESDISEEGRSDGQEAGDYEISWLDTFGTNTVSPYLCSAPHTQYYSTAVLVLVPTLFD